jgi:hypothetical protein
MSKKNKKGSFLGGFVTALLLAGGAYYVFAVKGMTFGDIKSMIQGAGVKIDEATGAQTVELKQGTEVDLLLLQPLLAGRAEAGSQVLLLAAEDIKDPLGQVLIKAGSPAKATVDESRGANLIGDFTGQGSKLTLDLKSIETVDGQVALLCADVEDPEATYELSRDALKGRDIGDALKAMWGHPESQKALKGLSDRLQGRESDVDLSDTKYKEILREAAQKLDMHNTAKLLEEDRGTGDAWQKLMGQEDGINVEQVKSLNSTDTVLLVQSLGELGKISAAIDRTARTTLKGRNIEIPAGMTVKARVEKTISIKPEKTEP